MPYKHNESCQHKFKKSKYRIINWREYNDALRKRGDITVYVTEPVDIEGATPCEQFYALAG